MTTIGIAYVGNFRYPWCTEVHIARTLELLGHRVLRLQEDRMTPESVEAATLDAGASLVLYTRTWGLAGRLTDVWRRLERRGVVTASYHLDLYLGLVRAATLEGDPFWSTQHVFTPDGDPESQTRFERLGINHHWMPPAAVADECKSGFFRARYAHDVVFVGSEAYHPEWPYRPQLIGWLADRYGHRFARYGAGTEVVRGQHLNDLYASARVVVGDSLCPNFSKPRYWSDRPYETVGRGGFLIMPHVPGLDDHFIDGKHLAFYRFGDWDQLGGLIDHYVHAPSERRRIAAAGQLHVRDHHTYTHRLADALATMGFE